MGIETQGHLDDHTLKQGEGLMLGLEGTDYTDRVAGSSWVMSSHEISRDPETGPNASRTFSSPGVFPHPLPSRCANLLVEIMLDRVVASSTS